jgi:hypothetical protein
MNELTLESLARRIDTLERQVSQLIPSDIDPPGTGGDEQSNDKDAISRWLTAFDAIPPATMTSDEEAAWQAARVKRKNADKVAIDQIAADITGKN